MPDQQLAGLQRCVSIGSKLILTGGCIAFSAVLLCTIVRFGFKPGPVKPPGLPIDLPVPFAVVVFYLIAIGLGWAGLAFLAQGSQVLRRLERNSAIPTDELKASLAGSSLASVSSVMFRLFCLATSLALIASPVGDYLLVNTLLLYVAAGHRSPLFFMVIWMALGLASIPYYYLAFCVWVRWFDPKTWSGKHWETKLLLWGWAHTRSGREAIQADQAGVRDRLSTEALKIGQYGSEAFMRHLRARVFSTEAFFEAVEDGGRTTIRRYGFFQAFSHDDEFLRFMELAREARLDTSIMTEFPEADVETRDHLKQHLQKKCSCDAFVRNIATHGAADHTPRRSGRGRRT